MKIKIDNIKKLESALKEIEARAKTRTLSVDDIQRRIIDLENRLQQFGLPKKYWNGTTATIGRCGKFPNAYKYVPVGTLVKIERLKTGWIVTDIRREACNGRDKLILTTEQQQYICCCIFLRYC